ncbi:flavin reductase family protein [Magnetovibrio sp. PR-2]|uniref:flavin reductase family protein n=1 Tax=Magnetovibrio sp. PR-2 TaxID=3120356 RepID=UPI002FCE4B54
MTAQDKTSNTIDAREFRDAMGSFATGICVVTANNAGGEAIGMTVNSFSSLSLEPPLVLVCLGVDSARSQALINAGRFNISILSDQQMDASNHFAQPGQGLAGEGMVEMGGNGAPVIPGAAAQIECDVEAKHPGGDHTILVGRVTQLSTNVDTQPLLYYRGSYAKLDGEA